MTKEKDFGLLFIVENKDIKVAPFMYYQYSVLTLKKHHMTNVLSEGSEDVLTNDGFVVYSHFYHSKMIS